jgi:small subunit ribosomal protein S4
MKLFLKGARCHMAKCAVETGRPPPGMHGQYRSRKLSDYGAQLREKQRLKAQYGMRERQFRMFFDRAFRRRGLTGEVLLQQLEMRLDNVVWRLGFAPSRAAARQLVRHGHILLDGRKVSIPSAQAKAGSVVQVKDKAKSLEAAQNRERAAWLSLDAGNFSGTVVRIPSKEEIAPNVNEQLVVELYAK